jgi:hypothetical protein
MAVARSLYVKVHDALTNKDTEYWFKKPNRYKIIRPDGSRTYSDGLKRIEISASGKRRTGVAPKRFPEAIRMYDFESFFASKPVLGELMGVDDYEFGGVKRRVNWVKTTESAIVFGQAFLDPVTMLPIGHRTTEQDQVDVDQFYPVVRLDLILHDSDFRPPASKVTH